MPGKNWADCKTKRTRRFRQTPTHGHKHDRELRVTYFFGHGLDNGGAVRNNAGALQPVPEAVVMLVAIDALLLSIFIDNVRALERQVLAKKHVCICDGSVRVVDKLFDGGRADSGDFLEDASDIAVDKLPQTKRGQ